MQEIWKDIDGYNGKYAVSNLGNVISRNYLNTGKDKLLAIKKHHTGYSSVMLCDGKGNHKNESVHSLVARAFIPNPMNKRTVNHIDGNKRNNAVTNLEWATYKENTHHAIKTGLRNPHYNNHPKGKNTPNSRHIMQYSLDGTFIKEWECISDAARFIGCSPSQIINNAMGRIKTCHGYIFNYQKVV